MLTIDRNTDGLVCLQLPENEIQGFVEILEGLLRTGKAEEIHCINGTLRMAISDGAFVIDVMRVNAVVLQMRRSDCQELLDAIVEHRGYGTEFPLDHSFEVLGAKILPNTIQDVVFETV